MSNEAKLSNTLPQIAIGDFGTGDLTLTSPTAAGRLFRGAPTEFNCIFENITTLLAVQSDKIDFGASRGIQYLMRATMELAAVAGAGDTINFYLAWSSSATPANGNVGNTTGSEGAWTIETSYFRQMTRVGSLVCDDGVVIQSGEVGIFIPKLQYANLVMVNNCDVNTAVSPGDECHVVCDALDLGN